MNKVLTIGSDYSKENTFIMARKYMKRNFFYSSQGLTMCVQKQLVHFVRVEVVVYKYV